MINLKDDIMIILQIIFELISNDVAEMRKRLKFGSTFMVTHLITFIDSVICRILDLPFISMRLLIMTSVDPNPRLYHAPRGIKSPVVHVGVL